MPVGGPAAFGIGLLEGLVRAQARGKASARLEVQKQLAILRERRQVEKANEEDARAIARAQAALNKDTVEARTAQQEVDGIHAEIERVRLSPGAPGKDSALEGRLADAHQRLSDAHDAVQESQGKLQDLIADRDARVRGAIPAARAGVPFFGRHDVAPSDRTPEQRDAYKQAIRTGEKANTTANAEFAKDARGLIGDAKKATSAEARESAKIKGLEADEAEGRKQQVPINEEKRDARLFPLRERETAAKGRLDVQNAGMEAAAEEIARRQADISGRVMPAMPAGGMPGMGASTGKEGGGGGLLGAITGKGGANGMPAMTLAPTGMSGGGVQGAAMGYPGPMQNGGPTVAQALAPIAGKLLQMPAPQAIATVRSVLGGAPPVGFASKDSFGSGAMGQSGTRQPGTSSPGQAGGRGTTHFHFHQAPAGSRAEGAAPMQGQDAPMPPPRPSFQGQGGQQPPPARAAGQAPNGFEQHPPVFESMEAQRAHEQAARSDAAPPRQPEDPPFSIKHYPPPPSRLGKQGFDRPGVPEAFRQMYRGREIEQLKGELPGSEGGTQSPPQSQQPQSSRASNLNQGVPTIHSPDQLKGMKPGSIFRAPDGSMRIIPAPGSY